MSTVLSRGSRSASIASPASIRSNSSSGLSRLAVNSSMVLDPTLPARRGTMPCQPIGPIPLNSNGRYSISSATILVLHPTNAATSGMDR
jgi:hypothetical protein